MNLGQLVALVVQEVLEAQLVLLNQQVPGVHLVLSRHGIHEIPENPFLLFLRVHLLVHTP